MKACPVVIRMSVAEALREPPIAPRMTGENLPVGEIGRATGEPGKTGYSCRRCARSGFARFRWHPPGKSPFGEILCEVPCG